LWCSVCSWNGMVKEVLLAIAVFAAVALAATLVLRRRAPAQAGDDTGPAEESAAAAAPVDLNQMLCDRLRLDLALAAEHVHSIRWLLEIARQHHQPIPSAALTNLELVSKHLGEMQRRVEQARKPEEEVSADGHPEALPAPPRRQQASAECHVSPSGISTPCG